MSHSESLRWCPECCRKTRNAPLPRLQEEADLIGPVALPGDPQGLRQRWYCVSCTSIWETIELPAAFVEQLLQHRDEVEHLKRQLALLRLLVAKSRRETTPRSEQPLRKAA
jgi:hypothetical protein